MKTGIVSAFFIRIWTVGRLVYRNANRQTLKKTRQQNKKRDWGQTAHMSRDAVTNLETEIEWQDSEENIHAWRQTADRLLFSWLILQGIRGGKRPQQMEYLSRLALDLLPSHSSEVVRRLRQIWAARHTLSGLGCVQCANHTCCAHDGDEGFATNLSLNIYKSCPTASWRLHKMAH